MKFNFQQPKFTVEIFRDYLMITLGSAIMCIGLTILVDVFIVPGGASGLSMALYYMFNKTIPMGIIKWIINIPLFIWGLHALGNQFGFRTFFGFTTASIFLDLFMGKYWSAIQIQKMDVVMDLAKNDFFFLVLVAGILSGIGLGIIFKYRGTTGGSDIPAAIFQQTKGISPGKTIMSVDCFVILSACLSFYFKEIPMERPLITLVLYAFLQLFLCSYIVDIIINGFDYARQAMIVTDKPEEVAQAVSQQLSRGATAVKTRGIYRNIDREMIMTVVTLKEVGYLRTIVKEVDKDAFMILTTVHEVVGHGFRRRV